MKFKITHFMKSIIGLIMVICWASQSLAQPTRAEIYKWVDSNGKVHYSDTPTSSKLDKLKLKTNSHDRVLEQNRIDTSKLGQENKKEVQDKTLAKQEKSGYCANLKKDMEYNKNGGELIVVDGNKFEQASEDVRQKNYKILGDLYNANCFQTKSGDY